MIPKIIFSELCRLGIEYEAMLSLKTVSTFRIGGVVELAVFPDNMEKLAFAVRLFREAEIPWELVGNASNVLFRDGVLEGALILTRRMSALKREGQVITAQCGVMLSALAQCAANASLSGLEFARGIPGTVGGAVFMNAGAYGGAISDVLVKSRGLDCESGELFELCDHAFGYRTGAYVTHPNWICLEGEFTLEEGCQEKIFQTMREQTEQRREKQPLEYPSAGSYFKRPVGHFAGKLIEDCGLKGYTVGQASVSQKHAGFIINLGGAEAADVLRLEEHIRAEVLREFGVELEREVRYIR